MNTNFTNFFNYAAKTPQNTGGGNSQKLTLVGAVWNESRTTVERRSTDGQSLRRPSITHLSKALKYAAMLLLTLTLSVGQMWATDAVFEATNSGFSSASTSNTKTVKIGNVTMSIIKNGGISSRQFCKNGGSSKNETSIQLSGNAGSDPTQKCIEIVADEGYKITSVSLDAVSAASSAGPNAFFFWSGAYSTTPNQATTIDLPSYNTACDTRDPVVVNVSSILDGTRTIRIYKQIRYNNGTLGAGSDSNKYPSSPQSGNYKTITVTYESTGGGGGGNTPSVSAFSPATGSTVGASQTITITGSTGSTVYYMWATSDPANAAAVVSADQHGTAGAASATTTVESGKNLYAVAVKDATNSTVASATYTIDATAPTLSSSTPANNATNVGTSGNIKLTFSENVTVNDASKFSISPSTGVTLSTPTVSGAVVTIPYSGLSEGTEYTFSTAAGAVKDGANNTSAALSDITFTTGRCEVTSCGNASLTYAINGGSSGNHSSEGADLIASATPSNPTALGASTTPGYTGIEMSTLTKNKAAATNSCFTEQINMSGKIDMNNGGSYSSSKYLQFTFTVKEGYTFTPCDIQFVVQPVSATGYFRWEVTDGTTSYGYGTGSAGKGSDAGATVLTGLSSTSEMSDGTYYIRLYPYYNGSNTFRIGDNVILRGTTAEAAPPASGWYLKGSFDTWGDGYAMAETGTNIVSVERTLDANSHYQFMIVNGSDWYGNGEIFGGTKTKTVSDIGTSNNCHLITSEEGKYRFDYNTETNALTITYPNSYTYYYSNTDGWSKVYVYKFSSKDEMTGDNDTWPGVEIETPTSLCGSYYAATSDGYAKIIFTNGLTGDNEKKTSDMVVASADAGKYVAGTGSAWVAMPTFSVTYNKNGDGAGNDGAVTGNVPTDATAYACGADVTVLGNTGSLALAGYSFNGWNTAPNGTGTAKVADETYAISDNTTFYAQWLQEIPTSVAIGGTWKYFPGQTITLTTTPTDGTSDFTYQWQQSNGSAWEDIEGANSDTYTKENCTVTDARKYRCIVSKLGASVTSDEYKVHIYTLEGDYSGGSDWKVYNIAQTSGTVGTVAVTLNASSLFEFGIKDNYDNSKWYTNANFIIDNWTNEGFGQGSGNCRLFTGPEGNYTFTVDIAHAGDETPYVEVSLEYPSVSHPAAGYAYFKKWNDWAGYYIHWWYNDGTDHPLTEWGSDVHITNETTICGTDYIYFPVIANYDQLKIKDAAGDASHYTGDLSSVGSSGKYFDFTNDNAWNTFETYTVTFNSNGGSAVDEQHVGCGGKATEPTAPTRLNYDFEGWQLAGADYNFATVVDNDITLDAVWTRKAVPGSETEEAYVADVEQAKENPVTPPYTGTAFDLTKVTGSCTIEKDKSNATNTADSKTYSYAFLPSNSSSESQCFNLTAKKAISSLVIYYTLTDGKFTTDDQSKSGAFTYKVNSGSAVTGASGDKSNKTAYKQTISNIAKDDVVKLYASSSRLAIFGIYATYTADAPTVKLKVLGEVTQTISITVGEKLGEIFASGSLPTLNLPGYTFNGWKNEDGDAAVNNNTVTTGSMVIYADLTADEYNVTLENGETDGAATVHYGETALTITTPVTGETGDVFEGFYTAATEGTKVADEEGNLVASVTGYTDADGKWIKESNAILYAIWTPYIPSSDATLSDLTVGGTTVAGFDAETISYDVELPFGTFVAPTVAGTANDEKAKSVVVTQAATANSDATVVVTAEDNSTKTYTVHFSVVATKNLELVWEKQSTRCGGTTTPNATTKSDVASVSTYINQITFTNVEGSGDDGKEGGSLNVGKKAGNMFTLSTKAGFAIQDLSFYAKIQDASCQYSLNGGEWTSLNSTSTGSDACYEVFADAEVHEFRLRSTGNSGVWIRNMQLTMIQACTAKTIAWTAEPAAEYELGSSPDAIAASANNGTVSYASTDGEVIAVNESTGALTLKKLGTVTLSASVAAGDGAIYCDEGAQVSKASVKTYYLVTFNKQNETAVVPVKYYSGSEAIALPEDPVYAGYDFQGWFDAAEGGNAVTSAITPTESRTVYAQWVAKCTGPTITTQPGDATYLVGRAASTLVAEASAAGEGELTYTWYACDDAERTNPVALAGAPTPSTAAAGTQYYYFTVTEAGCDVVKTSDVATITVVEKVPICIIKATPTSATTASVDGACKGNAYFKGRNDDKKLNTGNDYVGVELSAGYTFLATDRVVLNQTANLSSGDITKFYIFTEVPADGKTYVTVNNDSPVKGDNWFTMPAEMAGESTLYIGRVDAKCNPSVGYLAVYRTCAPIVNKVTVNGVDGTPDAANHIAFEVPYSTTQSQLEAIAYTWASNSDEWTAAHEPVAADEWTFGVENTVTFTDKDGDESVYYVTVSKATASTDATLASLTVNGKAIALEEDKYVYSYELPFGTTAVPVVAAEANDANRKSLTITQAASASGTATVVVVAEDDETSLTYTINFSVSKIPSYVIFDGSTMDAIAESGTGVSTFAWTMVGGNDGTKNINVTLNGKTYTKSINVFTSPTNSTTRYIEITIPEGYMAKFYLAGATNDNGTLRSSYISKEKTGTLDESIAYASTSSYDGMAMTSDFQPAGTYYYCCDASIRLYELSVTLYSIDYTRNVTAGRLGTICLPHGGTMRGAAVYEVAYFNPDNRKIYFDEVLSGEMEPGMPYVFLPDQGNNDQLVVTYGNNVPTAAAGHKNGLYGSFTEELLAKDAGNYIFSSNLYWLVNSDEVYVGENRAYLKVAEIYGYNGESIPPVAHGRRRITMDAGAQAPQVTTGVDEINASEQPMKLMIKGQIYILRGEKMYDVTGKVVK